MLIEHQWTTTVWIKFFHFGFVTLVMNPCGVVIVVRNSCQSTWSQLVKLPALFNANIPLFVHACGLNHRLPLLVFLRSRPRSAVHVSCSLLAQEEAAQHPGGPAARPHRVQDRYARATLTFHFLFSRFWQNIRHVVLVASSLLMPIMNSNTFIYIALYIALYTATEQEKSLKMMSRSINADLKPFIFICFQIIYFAEEKSKNKLMV